MFDFIVEDKLFGNEEDDDDDDDVLDVEPFEGDGGGIICD